MSILRFSAFLPILIFGSPVWAEVSSDLFSRVEAECPFLKKASPQTRLVARELSRVNEATMPSGCDIEIATWTECDGGPKDNVEFKLQIGNRKRPGEKVAVRVKLTPQGFSADTPIAVPWTRIDQVSFRLTCGACSLGQPCGCNKQAIQFIYQNPTTLLRVVAADPVQKKTLTCGP